MSLQRKVILGFLKGRDTFVCLPTGYDKSVVFASSCETSVSRETTTSIAGQASILKSLSPQKEKFQKHKINPRNGYSTDLCLPNTIHMAQMFLFKPLPQSTKS